MLLYRHSVFTWENDTLIQVVNNYLNADVVFSAQKFSNLKISQFEHLRELQIDVFIFLI